MEVIVMTNEKGGVGKTTTAITLATMLNDRGFKTLLIDANPTVNATSTYRARQGKGVATLYDVILAVERIPMEEAIQTVEKDGTLGDIVPGDKLMEGADIVLFREPEGIFRLKEALDELKGYDYVLIDTPQNYGSILQSCMIAADKLIVPCLADDYSEMGLSGLTKVVAPIKQRYNPKLIIDGILLVRVKNTKLRKYVETKLRAVAKEQIGTKVYRTAIRDCNSVPESQKLKRALGEFAPRSTAALDYKDVLDEMLGLEPKEENNGKKY